VATDDLERIRELSARLDELCREGKLIRERIASIARDMAPFPNRRDPARLFDDSPAPRDFRSHQPEENDHN
jgi:hypothetical protein